MARADEVLHNLTYILNDMTGAELIPSFASHGIGQYFISHGMFQSQHHKGLFVTGLDLLWESKCVFAPRWLCIHMGHRESIMGAGAERSSPECVCIPKIHYDDVIMTTIASQITSFTVVYSTVYSVADQRKHQSSASLAFVWGIHRDR